MISVIHDNINVALDGVLTYLFVVIASRDIYIFL